MAHTANELKTYQGVTIVTLLFSIYGNLDYYYHSKHIATPFTASFWMLFAFWVVLYLKQILFTLFTFVQDDDRLRTILDLGWHFPVFNVLIYFWAELFIHKHYFWSEVVLIINLFNVSYLYTKHKSYSIKPITRFGLIHVSVAAMPFSWLLYAVFWNGALMFHVREKLWTRILANIFIWNFLGIGSLLVYAFDDCAVGFSLSYLMFALMVGQLTIKVFALQWIFALAIAVVLFLVSSGALVNRLRGESGQPSEAAPLLPEQV
ncbi:uncharacterized protein SPAPADRAFT_61504 [Spathaspora passalidarum NRRL Y-27907]|uniref:DUF1774-domain-containing protein n=1 Tax=Spathaspora passalidarum (strain NRRL Y-27907 / 11-Y1) TaxID=619300 RepID=G3AN21_SPAPN|nr:uncharacterized protein SPAPADRAFT_61504 [Spathaspora passalidarum NRRL Y-27907]EGW32436.1 hypothetical protein SPAPADRAFT_61504 [Spathaspora passalidarum NRRL Y-27907]